MGKALLYLIIAGTSLQTLRTPFVGAMAYYCLAIWGPHYIWWWNFQGMRLSLIVALVAIVALTLKTFTKGLHFSLLKTRVNYCVLILWVCYCISYGLGPYVGMMGEIPWEILDKFSKIVLFYFVSVLLMDDLKKQKYFSWIMILTVTYMTYWANNQYLSQNWHAFNMGRLMGPFALDGGSIYKDENKFAVVFVTGVPFLFYWGLHMARSYVRYCFWAVIPLAWHAIFLTGSRGGLLGLATTLVGSFVFSKKKAAYIIIMVPLFGAAFYYQAGSLLKDRADTIVDYEGESSAETRIQAWRAALGMVNAHPLTGVGPGCFIKAMADFSPFKPRATHSTPFEFAAEIGIFAFCAYCWIVWQTLWWGLQTHRLLYKHTDVFSADEIETIRYLNESCSVSFLGLTVCSLFLSFNYYEIFYYLLIIEGFLTYYVRGKIAGTVSG